MGVNAYCCGSFGEGARGVKAFSLSALVFSLFVGVETRADPCAAVAIQEPVKAVHAGKLLRNPRTKRVLMEDGKADHVWCLQRRFVACGKDYRNELCVCVYKKEVGLGFGLGIGCSLLLGVASRSFSQGVVLALTVAVVVLCAGTNDPITPVS